MTEVKLAVSESIEKGKFKIMEKFGDMYLCKFKGTLKEVSDQWTAGGIMNQILEGYHIDFEDGTQLDVVGDDVYFTINTNDLPEVDIDDISN